MKLGYIFHNTSKCEYDDEYLDGEYGDGEYLDGGYLDGEYIEMNEY